MKDGGPARLALRELVSGSLGQSEFMPVGRLHFTLVCKVET
jgi:hypothetical protein